ncbi:MAG: hypothetical protein MJ101_06850 [Clostridia bacterium]|nr:hypothetical protein [Clostridia bacterium]
MSNRIKSLFTDPNKKAIILVCIGAVGVLLVIAGAFTTEKADVKRENSVEIYSDQSYIDGLENKIGTMTRQITGSSDVTVVITAELGTESVFASNDIPTADGIEREYITVRNDSGGYELVLVNRIYPKISGICVVCHGGDDPMVQKKLISAISTSMNISSNRICIVGAK